MVAIKCLLLEFLRNVSKELKHAKEKGSTSSFLLSPSYYANGLKMSNVLGHRVNIIKNELFKYYSNEKDIYCSITHYHGFFIIFMYDDDDAGPYV